MIAENKKTNECNACFEKIDENKVYCPKCLASKNFFVNMVVENISIDCPNEFYEDLLNKMEKKRKRKFKKEISEMVDTYFANNFYAHIYEDTVFLIQVYEKICDLTENFILYIEKEANNLEKDGCLRINHDNYKGKVKEINGRANKCLEELSEMNDIEERSFANKTKILK